MVARSQWAAEGRGWGEPGRTPWVPEDIASMSIGQMVVQVTPIQIARAYAAFANGGYLVTPYLTKKDGEFLSEQSRIKIDINPKHIQLINSGLRKVVESGTGVAINSQSLIYLQSPGKQELLKIGRLVWIMLGFYALLHQRRANYL